MLFFDCLELGRYVMSGTWPNFELGRYIMSGTWPNFELGRCVMSGTWPNASRMLGLGKQDVSSCFRGCATCSSLIGCSGPEGNSKSGQTWSHSC